MLERSQKPEVRMKLVDCAVREQAAMPPGADSNRRQAEFPLNLQGVVYFSPAGAMLSTLIDLSSVRVPLTFTSMPTLSSVTAS